MLETLSPWPGLSETRWRWGAGLEADVYCFWLSAGPLGSRERELEPRLRRGSFLSLLTCASLSRSRFQAHRSSRSKTTAPPLRPPGALCCLHSSPFASLSTHTHTRMRVHVCARVCVRPGPCPSQRCVFCVSAARSHPSCIRFHAVAAHVFFGAGPLLTNVCVVSLGFCSGTNPASADICVHTGGRGCLQKRNA